MTVTLRRYQQDLFGTHGQLEDSGGNVLCYTIERPWLNNAHNISCIPTGTYACTPHVKSNNGQRCWEVTGVPDRTGILIHTGNVMGDSEGCIIVGLLADATGVAESELALYKLQNLLQDNFTLEIVSAVTEGENHDI